MQGMAEAEQGGTIITERWLSFDQVMAITGMKRTFIQSEMNSGRLKSLKVGRCRKVKKSELEAWMSKFDGAGEIN
ncbi:helix-turn-helix domain-containing protein [Schlesneria sp. DSM 10557]|uniref:helix-turn-helix domain-containing protein n=1 Tax=Schlesneria sp. DSM 10557 TaxID=3044399 RepID=UPI0035A18213